MSGRRPEFRGMLFPSKEGKTVEQKKHRDRPELYDSGCMLLIEAIVRRAAEDHLAALGRRQDRRTAARIRETAAFFRSDYFSRLTGMQGSRILEMILREAKKHDRA